MDETPSPDPAFPRLHGRPRKGWVNDPNGLFYWNGTFHVFYQYNPHSARHVAIKWGHASSTDLLRWRQEPVALENRPGELDEYGCWSGCMVDDDGTATAVYSGVLDDDGRSNVLLARGDRELREWKQARRPAATMPEDPDITDVRDPFVFEFMGHRYALQGAGNRSGRPQVLIYACDDLTSWTLLGPFLTVDDPIAAGLTEARIWECPNLAQIEERWVLIISLWRTVDGAVVMDQVRYLVGDVVMRDGGPRFRAESAGQLDDGLSFYAPQILKHEDRVLMWGWSRDLGRSQADIDAAGWAGTLTFCRELSLDGDVVVSRPVAELTALRSKELPIIPGQPFMASAFEIEGDPDGPPMSLALLDGSRTREVAAWKPHGKDGLPPRVLVDGSIIEVFDGGPTSTTTRAYPTTESPRWILDSSDPTVAVRAWLLD